MQSYLEFDHDAIYVNASVTTGVNATLLSNQFQDLLTSFNYPSLNFKVINQDVIVKDPSQYYLTLSRCNLSTNTIPKFIFPIQNGIGQPFVNLSPYAVGFVYYDALGVKIYEYYDVINYVSEVLDDMPFPPSQNNGYQDFVNIPTYYYVYSIAQMLYIFNLSISGVFASFANGLQNDHGVIIDRTLYPFYTYDDSTKLFALNFPKSLFDPSVFPRITMGQDIASVGLFDAPYLRNTLIVNKSPFYVMAVRNLFNNTVVYNSIDYFAMHASQNTINLWCPVTRILFVSDNIPIRKLEVDVAFTNIPFSSTNQFGTSPSASSSFQIPVLPIFFDLQVNPDQWVNKEFIEYTTSSIAQSRLIALGSGVPLQNFQVSVYWQDIYNNPHPLVATPNTQNNIKLGMFKKSTNLM